MVEIAKTEKAIKDKNAEIEKLRAEIEDMQMRLKRLDEGAEVRYRVELQEALQEAAIKKETVGLE